LTPFIKEVILVVGDKMKKFLVVLSIALTFALVSCQNGAKLTVTMDYQVTETEIISAQTLSDMLANKETFILYVSSETCLSCQEFEPILMDFIQINHVLVYEIESSSQFSTNNGILDYEFTPTIFFILEGNVIHSADPLSDDSAFADASGFAEFFDNWVSLTTNNI